MDHAKLEKYAYNLYPDERKPGRSNEYMQEPDIIISHEDLRQAFIYGYQMGFNHGKIKQEEEKYERHYHRW